MPRVIAHARSPTDTPNLARHARHDSGMDSFRPLSRGVLSVLGEPYMSRSRSPKSRAAQEARVHRRQRDKRPAKPGGPPKAAQWAVRRRRVLRALAARTRNLPWSPDLINVLVDELNVTDEFTAFVGEPQKLPRRRYPQMIAFAMALRHSWRADDLACLLRRLGLRRQRR